MRRRLRIFFPVFYLLLFVATSIDCSKKEPSVATEIDAADLRLFQPLPELIGSVNNPLTEEKVALGRMLYFEPRLSKSHQISCNSCHLLDKYGVDQSPTSSGHKQQKGSRNSPTVYNAAGHSVQFWDGRAADVEAQAKGPILNPAEMAMPSERRVVAVVKSMPAYVAAFKRAFPKAKEPVTYTNMATAIAAFERKLVTPSRWDKFLKGDTIALSTAEKRGFNDYVQAGCPRCHAGTYVGGNLLQKVGLAKAWPDTSDTGREKITRSAADRMVFKVPSLRNVEKTAPYFHNGKTETLDRAISQMAEYQLGKTLSDEQIVSISVWLKSLTGEIPVDYIKAPPLPRSTSRTPKPDFTY